MLELRIVFDTSSIFTESDGHLLAQEVGTLIKNQPGDENLKIDWYLPDVVVRERVYQIQRRASKLFQQLEELEKVARHSFKMTEETLRNRIVEHVQTQIVELGVNVCEIKHDQVDWSILIENSINRRAPFEEKPKNEKGFRDAVILETFIQLLDASPNDAQRCRVVLVTNDGPLADATTKRTTNRQNVQILKSIDDVKGLINTLLSSVSEGDVKVLQKVAETFFLTQEPRGGIFRKLEIRKQIIETCKDQLAAIPAGADRRENDSKWVVISAPRFVKKEHQRVWWASKVKIRARAFVQASQPSSVFNEVSGREMILPASESIAEMAGEGPTGPTGPNYIGSGSDYVSSSGPYIGSSGPAFIGSSGSAYVQSGSSFVVPPGSTFVAGPLIPLPGGDRLFAEGSTTVNVTWSASVDQKRTFSDPKLESIDFVETVWEPR